MTITRSNGKEWSGYKRQPKKHVEYVGFTVYLPKTERKDVSIYNAKNIELTKKRVLIQSLHIFSRIFQTSYSDVYFQGVEVAGNAKKNAELGFLNRFGTTYSENNMGFGEGRILYTVDLLESCPEKSLIFLEEPETSLHESAQFELAKYFLDVASRRGHQIVFSTHSSVMMDALPPEGRKLLMRSSSGVDVTDRVSSTQIKIALSAGHSGHLIICVEDLFAQSMLREILLTYNKNLSASVAIIPFGDANSVINAQRTLNSANCRAISVRDGDQTENVTAKIFKLPGTLPPEKEVFNSNTVKMMLLEKYGIDFETIRLSDPDLDHHDFSKACCEKISFSREVIESDCIRTFLTEVGEKWFESLCKKIQECI